MRLTPTRLVLVLASLFLLGFVAFVSVPRTSSSIDGVFVKPVRTAPSQVVSALDWLPRDAVRDGSVDYTVNLQAAIDAAADRTLLLPDFPVLVSKRPGKNWCLVVRAPVEIRGSVSSEIVELFGDAQILRIDHVEHVRLAGFELVGRGGQGADFAHGLLHVVGGEDVAVEDVVVRDSDADGIAFVDVDRATVRGCRVLRASRAGIHLSGCAGGIVADNVVEDGTGHRDAQGAVVGAGIELSGVVDVACTGNVVRDGIGTGILVDASASGAAPIGCTVVGNRVAGWRNPTNPSSSSGIRLESAAGAKPARTLVAANAIERCGSHGIDVEGHDGASILGNSVVASDRSAILVATSRGVQVLSNVVLDADAESTGAQAGLHLVDGAAGVVAQGNRIGTRDAVPAVASVRDESTGGGNSVEPQQRRASAPPETGLFARGDVVWNSEPWPGAPLGWVCTSSGSPGVWSVLGRIE